MIKGSWLSFIFHLGRLCSSFCLGPSLILIGSSPSFVVTLIMGLISWVKAMVVGTLRPPCRVTVINIGKFLSSVSFYYGDFCREVFTCR